MDIPFGIIFFSDHCLTFFHTPFAYNVYSVAVLFIIFMILQVSRHLFRWTKEMAYADYYERALTNGVLSIQRGTEPGVMIYMLPLGNGRSKADSYHGWGTRFNTFWCCYGTGVIYMEYIQLFVSHEIDLLYFSLIFVITKIQILFLCSLNFMIGFLVSSGLTKSFSLLCHLVFLY